MSFNQIELSSKRVATGESQREEIRVTVRAAIELRRRAIVYEIARKFESLFENVGAQAVEVGADKDDDWLVISSLSQLRSSVGGRFKNLKEKWVAAGFPLREHRGDRSVDAELNYDSWVELSVWINRQGYDARLISEEDGAWGEEGFFEVRQREKG